MCNYTYSYNSYGGIISSINLNRKNLEKYGRNKQLRGHSLRNPNLRVRMRNHP